jgi:regulator of sigma E protease
LAALPFGAEVTLINGDSVRFWEDVRGAVLDVTSDRLRFDFAGGLDPVIVPIAGTSAGDRVAIYEALMPVREARIATVTPGRPASRAGLEAGDLIIRANDDTVRHWGDLLAAIEPAAGDTVRLTVDRAGTLVGLEVVPDEVPESTRDPLASGDRRVGFIGVGQAVAFERVRFGLVGAAREGVRMTVNSIAQVVYTVRGLILMRISPQELGGPIIIGQLSGQAARLGPSAFLTFMAFISINLAIFNLLPVPVLDGGHLVFLLVEGIRGRPVSVEVRLRFTQVGLAMLLVLVVYVMFNDIARVVGG